MKQIFLVLLALGLVKPVQSFADKNFDIALELARSSKVEKIIKNINEINSLTSQYILETADLSVTRDKIKSYFDTKDMLWKNYNSGLLTYSLDSANMFVTIGSIMPSTVSKFQKRLFKNSPNLADNTVINDNGSLSINIPLTQSAISFVSLIKTIDTNKANISKTKPTDTSKLWYKPDGSGSFTIYKIDNGTENLGKLSTQKTSSAVVVSTKTDLDKVSANKGSVGFVVQNNKATKYIFDGTQWINISGGQGIKTVSTCTQDTLGALRYSDTDGCKQFCSFKNGTAGWECLESE